MNDDEIELAEYPESGQSVDYAGKKRRIVILLLAYSAIIGIISCFLPEEDTPLDLFVALPLLILGISWCFTDADQRDHRIGRLMRLVVILMLIVGFPIYLLQTRGIGAFKTLAFTLVLVGAMFTCAFVTGYATFYVGGAAGLWELAD